MTARISVRGVAHVRQTDGTRWLRKRPRQHSRSTRSRRGGRAHGCRSRCRVATRRMVGDGVHPQQSLQAFQQSFAFGCPPLGPPLPLRSRNSLSAGIGSRAGATAAMELATTASAVSSALAGGPAPGTCVASCDCAAFSAGNIANATPLVAHEKIPSAVWLRADTPTNPTTPTTLLLIFSPALHRRSSVPCSTVLGAVRSTVLQHAC